MNRVIFVNARIAEGQEERLLQELNANASASRREPGCFQFDILRDPQDPLALSLYEVYADDAAFEAHQQTAHHKRYFTQAHDLLAHRQRTLLQRSDSPPHRKSSTMSIALVITCVAKPGSLPELLDRLHTVAAASRTSEPGCLQFDVLQDQADEARITLYEVYADAAAAEAHKQTPHFAEFIAKGVPLYASHALKQFERAAPN